ncbi:MAG: hypothetical protein HZA22_06550 [Nitrospirae bacterium]|nr:hypothetical protein [Nitrospirota bacterium]
MAKLSDLLVRLEEFEGKLALLYDCYAGRFTHTPDVSELFAKLGFEENSHRDIVRYEGRVVKNDPDYFGDIDANIKLVEENLERVAAAIETRYQATVEEAVGFALTIEKSSLENLYLSIPETLDPAFGRIVTAMKAGCTDHVAAVTGIIRRHGLNIRIPKAA